MDNQHRKISGYRELSEAEIKVINFLKSAEREALGIVDLVGEREGADPRWVEIAKTDIERGFMALIRAVAKPNTETGAKGNHE